MSTNRRQTLEAAYVAASSTTRRRCLPPRPRVPMPVSLHLRWRERPRRRALRLTPARPDGVVHAIVGRVAGRYLRAQIGQEKRAVRASDCAPRFSQTKCADESAGTRPRTRPVLRRPRQHSAPGTSAVTIASMMLAPCSASSMLSASLRPGRWPGLRALTTPPRGTSPALTRWWLA
jgi:hypothetical protein